jgi:frataxin-like iron-binding protein CyaY
MIPTTWSSVDSSNVDSIKYDTNGNNLHVRFKNGSEYIYEDVEPELAEGLYHASSAGNYLRENIIGTYTHRRV